MLRTKAVVDVCTHVGLYIRVCKYV